MTPTKRSAPGLTNARRPAAALVFAALGLFAPAGQALAQRTAPRMLADCGWAADCAMGGTGAARNDLWLYGLNPAGLASLARPGVAFGRLTRSQHQTQHSLVLGAPLRLPGPVERAIFSPVTGDRTASAVYPYGRGLGALAAGYSGLEHSPIQGNDEFGNDIGPYRAGDRVFWLAYGLRLTPTLSAGAAAKSIHSLIADARARTWAADMGVQATPRPGSPWSAGLQVRNLGAGLRYLEERSPLPLTLSAGLAYSHPSGFTAALDLSREVYDRRLSAAAGLQIPFGFGFTLRAGYLAQAGLNRAETGWGQGPRVLSNLGLGFGLRRRNMSVDYSFSPYGQMGAVNRIDVGLRF